jgi:hypothetical protein
MQIHGSQLDTHGEGLPNAKTMFNIKPTQILMVNQLWLWILDSGMSSLILEAASLYLTSHLSRYHYY